MMKMNDPVTESNGEQAIWIDGKSWKKRQAANQSRRQRISQRQMGMGQFHAGPGRRTFRGLSMAQRRKAEFELSVDALIYHGCSAGTRQQGLV